MKISVVIPAYNAEKYIGQCIEGILHQTHKDLEVIVVNDGSTDRTAEIAAAYSEVKLISQPNQGQSVARNVGAASATGDYIHFMDADDLLCLDYYARMAEAATATDADMAFLGGVLTRRYLPRPRLSPTACCLPRPKIKSPSPNPPCWVMHGVT